MALRWTRELLQLLSDCEVTPYKSSGPGGQKKNKTESSVRVRHLPSGIVRIGTESRSQARNREAALRRLAALLRDALAPPPPPRRPTRPSAAAQRRSIEAKRRRGTTKALRRRPDA